MLQNLKLLKTRIENNLIELTKIHFYAPYFLDSLDAQITLNPREELLKIWLYGGNDLLIEEITKALDMIENKQMLVENNGVR